MMTARRRPPGSRPHESGGARGGASCALLGGVLGEVCGVSSSPLEVLRRSGAQGRASMGDVAEAAKKAAEKAAAEKAAAERKKQNHPDAATAGVPVMDPDDTSATGMLKLEDLDDRFAESVFGNDS